MNPRAFLLVALILAPGASAQISPFYVTDAGADSIWRCADLNNDGDLNDAGEVVAFYADTLGQVPFQTNVGIRSTPDDSVFVTDSGEDSVFLLRDSNSDGDANDAGEAVRWFDGRAGGNPGGLLMGGPNGIIRQSSSGAWFVANSGATLPDTLLRLVDANSDGDANDVGEATEYWSYAATPGGDSVPQAVEIGLDDNVYLLDAPSSGPNGKGVYRLVDLNADGDAKDAGEIAPFFIPPSVLAPFYWCLELGPDGWFYTADTGNEVVWRFRDLNADGDAQDVGESSAYWTVGAASTLWDLAVASDGSIYLVEGQTTQRLWRIRDADANGVIGAGESTEIYNETLAAAVIGTGRGIDLVRVQNAGTTFCFGDGSGAACPCGNAGAADGGCANSIYASGGHLEGQGVASIGNDTLVLVGSRMPNSSALYFQGTSSTGGGLGIAFGDGLRCAGGAVIRLGTKFNVAGTSRFPVAGDPTVSVRGLDSAGDARVYQVWYRNAAAFCAPETFNLTNAVSLTWAP